MQHQKIEKMNTDFHTWNPHLGGRELTTEIVRLVPIALGHTQLVCSSMAISLEHLHQCTLEQILDEEKHLLCRFVGRKWFWINIFTHFQLLLLLIKLINWLAELVWWV